MNAIIVSMQTLRAGRTLVRRANALAEIGLRFRAAREAAGLRKVDLSASTGIAENTLSQWESGQRRPSLDQALLALPALRITLDWLYFGEESGLLAAVRDGVLAKLDAYPPPTDAPADGAAREAVRRSGA